MDLATGAHYLYPFLLRDQFTGRWYRARWKATAEDIAARGGNIDGPGELVYPIPPHTNTGCFVSARSRLAPGEAIDTEHPTMDPTEVGFARLFLRRYVTHCIRRRGLAQAEGAAAFWRELDRQPP